MVVLRSVGSTEVQFHDHPNGPNRLLLCPTDKFKRKVHLLLINKITFIWSNYKTYMNVIFICREQIDLN